MSAVPSAKHCEVLPPLKRSTVAGAYRMADGQGDWFTREEPSHRKRRSHSRFLMMFVLGAVAALGWQSYGRAARQTVAGLSPQLQWLAPPTADANTDPDRIGQITRSIDRIASNLATTQEQMTRSIDHLAAGQEQMTTEIIRLRAIALFASPRIPDPPAHPAPHPVRRRTPQAR